MKRVSLFLFLLFYERHAPLCHYHSRFFSLFSERKHSVRTVRRADRRGITDVAVRTEGTPPPSALCAHPLRPGSHPCVTLLRNKLPTLFIFFIIAISGVRDHVIVDRRHTIGTLLCRHLDRSRGEVSVSSVNERTSRKVASGRRAASVFLFLTLSVEKSRS